MTTALMTKAMTTARARTARAGTLTTTTRTTQAAVKLARTERGHCAVSDELRNTMEVCLANLQLPVRPPSKLYQLRWYSLSCLSPDRGGEVVRRRRAGAGAFRKMACLRYSLSLRERAGVRVVVDRCDEVQYRFHCYSH